MRLSRSIEWLNIRHSRRLSDHSHANTLGQLPQGIISPCVPRSLPISPPTPPPASFETFTKLLYISRTFVQMSSQSGERVSLKNPSRSRIRPSSGSRGCDVDRQRVKCRQIKSWRPGDSSTRASREGEKKMKRRRTRKKGRRCSFWR